MEPFQNHYKGCKGTISVDIIKQNVHVEPFVLL